MLSSRLFWSSRSCMPLRFGRKRRQRDPLTEAQIEQIREAGIDPDERIRLYTEFLDEHVDTIKGLIPRPIPPRASPPRQRTTGSYLADGRARLQPRSLRRPQCRHSQGSEAVDRVSSALARCPSRPAAESGFDLSRKEAIESGEDLADQASANAQANRPITSIFIRMKKARNARNRTGNDSSVRRFPDQAPR